MAPRIDASVAALLQPAPCQRGMRHRPVLDTLWRMACMTAGLLLIASIFFLGEGPVAAGLFATPYDKLAHFTTYLLLTVLLGFAGLRAFPSMLFLFGVSLGALDELHQAFVPGRIGSWLDFLVDVSAVLAAVLGMLEIHKKPRQRTSSLLIH